MAVLRLLPAALALVAALPAAEVRVAIRPQALVAAPQARLADVAELSGDPQGVAALADLPVVGISGLAAVRIDERRVRAAVARHAREWELVVAGVGRVAAEPRRLSAEELVAAARAALPADGDRIEAMVARCPSELVVPDLGPGLELRGDLLDRGQAAGEVAIRVRAMRGDSEHGRALVVLSVRRWRRLVVAAAPIPRGQVVQAADVRQEEVAVERRHADALADPAVAVGQLTTRDLVEGEVLMRWNLAPRPAVAAGRPVILLWRRGGIELSVAGEAMASGRIGDRIHVRRPDGQTVQARILTEGVAAIGE